MLCQVRFVPRFAVEQGLKPDGSVKIRAVDHMSWSRARTRGKKRCRKDMKAQSLNGHSVIPERVAHDHLDCLEKMARSFWEAVGEVPGLWKADIDAAFRRIPLRADQQWAAGIAYVLDGAVWACLHKSMPFGASSSVYAWHRVGHLLGAIARRTLFVAVGRYVDDFFGVERKCTMEHAMGCFARLVRALLGATAVADRKLECGHELTVLGMLVQPDVTGIAFTVAPEKACKWTNEIATALELGQLDAGLAQKLAGRLMWSTQHLFYRIGRAMVKPIFAQKYSIDGKFGGRLRIALLWWLRVLREQITEVRLWRPSKQSPCHLFVDAASTPARAAAVFIGNGKIAYTDGQPAHQLMEQLCEREDKQIMSLEIIAIMLALTTFAPDIAGRKVIVHSDNSGAEASTIKGSSRAFDHNQLVHEIWSFALSHKVRLWVMRVPSDDNISDSPSRFDYELLEEIGAEWRSPVMLDLRL